MGKLQLPVSATLLIPSLKLPLTMLSSYDLQFWYVNYAIVKSSRLFVNFTVYCRYTFGFGSPVSRALGIGYVQELVARLTHTPIKTHNSSTNVDLHNNTITFPLDQSLYVDATHDAVILNGDCLSSLS